jgi:hypothetical protein
MFTERRIRHEQPYSREHHDKELRVSYVRDAL